MKDRHMKIHSINRNLFIIYILVIYFVSIFLRLFWGEDAVFDYNSPITLSKGILNVIITGVTIIAVIQDKKFGMIVFVIWQMIVTFIDFMWPEENKSDIIFLDIVSNVFWIALILINNRIHIGAFLSKTSIYSIGRYFKNNQLKENTGILSNEINDINVEYPQDTSSPYIKEQKTQSENGQHIPYANELFNTYIQKIKHTINIFKDKKYIFIAITILGVIVAITFGTKGSEAGEYVYIEQNKHIKIIHSNMNCSKISKGTVPTKTSSIKHDLSTYSSKYYNYCPRCTNPDFVKSLMGKTVTSLDENSSTTTTSNVINRVSSFFSNNDKSSGSGDFVKSDEEEQIDDDVSEDDSYLDDIDY